MNLQLHQEFPADLKGEWNLLLDDTACHVPFLRYEYLSQWWETRGGGEWPDAQLCLVTAHENGRLLAAAPLFVANHEGKPRLLLVGSIEISDFLDLLVRPADLPQFLEALLPFLRQADLPHWEALDLYNLLDSSPTLAALEQVAAHLGWRFCVEPLQHSPYIPLPGDWDAYLAGIDKKQRHEIRRKMRRLEEAAVAARWYIVNQRDGLEDEIQAFIDLMSQDEQKAAFLTHAMRRQMLETMICAFDEGCLQLAFLEINGQKAAAYLSFDYLKRLWVYNSGVDRSFMEYSPGWVLLGYLLRWANENGYTEFDFMRGNEDYKYRFGAVDRFVVRATLEPGA